MELKLNREALCVNEVVYDGINEQSVEFDYILPDYYPAIFKILKCQLTPRIVSYNTTSDRLTYDAVVQIKVLYCAEDSRSVKCVDQRFSYSKTIELSRSCSNPQVTITPKLDYCNCRAVSERRLDIRGAVSCKVRVTCKGIKDIISNMSGMGVQCRKKNVNYDGGRLYTSKQNTLRETIELSPSKPPAQTLIRYDAVATAGDCKLIANKVIAKGEAVLTMLYATDIGNGQELETMQMTIPISQIIDLEGINEEYICYVDMNVAGCDVVIKQGNDDENRIFSVEIVILTTCNAHKETQIQYITDSYSTDFSTSFTTDTVKVEMPPTRINQSFIAESTVEFADGTIDAVLDAWSMVSNITTKAISSEEIVVSATLTSCILARASDGTTIYLESNEVVDNTIMVAGVNEDSVFFPTVCVNSTSFSLASNNAVEVRSEICIRGCLYDVVSVTVTKEIKVDEGAPKKKDTTYALKIYYADIGEDVWNIAKRYNTSVNAIMDENELETEVLQKRGMILIPIID
ncbi:MAG TPA: DUF3794 domain-containing protein [Oscillospiraceae bacterium]|nr:DUF3794 domain-containing protein [Oscillospiraceae bacterium]